MSASPDGSALLFSEQGAGKSAMMIYSFKERTSAPFAGVTSSVPIGAEFSADGKWVACSAREHNESTLIPYVQPYPATGAKYQITSSREGGHTPVWFSDDRELFFTPGPGRLLSNVTVTTSPSFSFGPDEPVDAHS